MKQRLAGFAGIRALAVAAGLCGALSSTGAMAAYGENMLVNGGAEASAGVPGTGTTTMLPPSGWSVTGTLTAAQYGGSGGFPTATSAGPVDRGSNFFIGGRSGMGNATPATASQTISLAAYLGDIAGGQVGYSFSAWLGGYGTDGDNAKASVSFLDASNNVLFSASLPAVTAADRGNTTGLLFREASGYVPAGATSATVLLTMTKVKGMYNDATADNIAFTLAAPVPEPETCAMLLTGLGLMGTIARRRRNAESLTPENPQ